MKKRTLLFTTLLTCLLLTSCGGSEPENKKAQEILDNIVGVGKAFTENVDKVSYEYDDFTSYSLLKYEQGGASQSFDLGIKNHNSRDPMLSSSISGLQGQKEDMISSGTVKAKVDAPIIGSLDTVFDYYDDSEKYYVHMANETWFIMINIFLKSYLSKKLQYPSNLKFYIDKSTIKGYIGSIPDVDITNLESLIDFLPLPTSWNENEDGSYDAKFVLDKLFLAELSAEAELWNEGKTHKDVNEEEWNNLVSKYEDNLKDTTLNKFNITIYIDKNAQFESIYFDLDMKQAMTYNNIKYDVQNVTTYKMNFTGFNDEVHVSVPADLSDYGQITLVDA